MGDVPEGRSSILEREKQVRTFGKDTAHDLAQRLARLAGSDAADTEPNAGGIAIHALLGMVPGAVYARARRAYPGLRAGRSAAYGFALFVVNDEFAGRVSGSWGPSRVP